MDRRPRLTALAQLSLMFGLTVLVLTVLSPGAVIGGGWWPKALFLLRMAVLLAAATWLLRLRGLTWADVGLRRPRVLRFLAAVPLGLVGGAGAAALVRLSRHAIGPHAGPGVGPGADYAMFNPLAHHLGEYLFWLFASWTTAALGEEMLFRGFMLDAARRLIGEGRAAILGAIVVQALLFGVMHAYQGATGAMVAGALGAVLGLVWWGAGRNLWPSVVIHGLFDSAAMTVIFLGLLPK